MGGSNGAVAHFEQEANAPLPVELVSFRVTAQSDAVELRWRTASEHHSAFFEVEVGTDGRAFQRLDRVAGQGTTSQATDYAWRDPDLGRYPVATVYYRLRQVDHDGSFRYSAVRAVTIGRNPGLALFPDPATRTATLRGAWPGTVVAVYDMMGRLVLAATADTTGTTGLAPGPGLDLGVKGWSKSQTGGVAGTS